MHIHQYLGGVDPGRDGFHSGATHPVRPYGVFALGSRMYEIRTKDRNQLLEPTKPGDLHP